jgi:hypothetical protein
MIQFKCTFCAEVADCSVEIFCEVFWLKKEEEDFQGCKKVNYRQKNCY